MAEAHLESDISLEKPKPLMPENSRYAGQFVDNSSRRSVEILSAESSNGVIDPTARYVIVNNFYHEGCFWKAEIPLDGIDEVFGQYFNFSKPKIKPGTNPPEVVFDKHGIPKRTISVLNHIQSRFTLKAPHTIKLYSMANVHEPVHQLSDFIYTVEAVGPQGIVFNVRDGLAGSLIATHRFLSTQEMVFERIVLENQYIIELPAIPINDAQKKLLLTKSLLRSHQAGMTEPYYLFKLFGTNNCTSIPFQLLDQVLDYTFTQRLGTMLYRLPLSPKFYLRARGLDCRSKVRKILRTEFNSYIHDPNTQQRKQAKLQSENHDYKSKD